jgi:hypothetical protein
LQPNQDQIDEAAPVRRMGHTGRIMLTNDKKCQPNYAGPISIIARLAFSRRPMDSLQLISQN